MQVWINTEVDGPVDSHEYNITPELEGLVLSRSNSPSWTRPNEDVATLSDDGDGVIITVDKKSINLDYEEVIIVLSLLMANTPDKIELRETKTIKSL